MGCEQSRGGVLESDSAQSAHQPSPAGDIGGRNVTPSSGGTSRNHGNVVDVTTAIERRHAKFLEGPYVSDKRMETKHLNGTQVRDGVAWCRHFAQMYTTVPVGQKGTFVTQLNNQKNINTQVAQHGALGAINTRYYNTVKNTPAESKHAFNQDQLGEYLSSLANALQHSSNPESLSADALLLTDDHAMAIQVEIKQKHGLDYVSAKLYDPNTTNTYKRIVVPDANDEMLKGLSLKDMLVEPERANYYGLTLLVACLHETVVPEFDRVDTFQDMSPIQLAQFMYVSLSKGSPNDVSNVIQFLQNNAVPPKTIADTLSAIDPDGTPGFHKTLLKGHIDTINVFANATQQLESATKIQLLSAKDGHGQPGFLSAMIKGDAETVKAFGNAVQPLDSEVRAQLLRANGPDGFSGMHLAMLKGNTDAVRAFGETLTGLKNDRKVELLAAKSNDGSTGLFAALEKGHANTIRAFGDTMVSLTSRERATLLYAGDAYGRPGLLAALRNEHTETIDAYGELIMLLAPEERSQVTNTLSNLENDIIDITDSHDSSEAIDAFITLLNNANPH